MFKHIWASGSSFQTQHFINNINNVKSSPPWLSSLDAFTLLIQFHLKSQRTGESQCKILPSARAQFQWWFEVPLSLILAFLICSEQGSDILVTLQSGFSAIMPTHWCWAGWVRVQEVNLLENSCRVGLEIWATADLFFPVTDVQKKSERNLQKQPKQQIKFGNFQGSGQANTLCF